MSQSPDALLDLDGTLVDSFEGIASAYPHVLAELELGDMDDTELARFVGPPIQRVLEQHFELTGPRLYEESERFAISTVPRACSVSPSIQGWRRCSMNFGRLATG